MYLYSYLNHYSLCDVVFYKLNIMTGSSSTCPLFHAHSHLNKPQNGH